MTKKTFFRDLTPGKIKRSGERIEVKNIGEAVEAHLSTQDNNYWVQVMERIIPEGYSPVSYQRDGPITWTREFSSVGECLEARIHPWILMRDAVNAMEEATLGIGLLPPLLGNGERGNTYARVTPWKEIFEAARLFAYAHLPKDSAEGGAEIELNIKRAGAAMNGAQIYGTVPSRRDKIKRWDVQIQNVPATPVHALTDKEVAVRQFYIPLTIEPSNPSEKAFYRKLQNPERGGKYIPVMWSDIALYFEYVQHEVDVLNEQKETMTHKAMANPPGYFAPAIEFTPFPLVTKSSAAMYMKIINRTLNQKGGTLRDAEVNLALGELALRWKYMRTFFSKMSQDGRMAGYGWKIPGK